MARLFIRHRVGEFAPWFKGYSENPDFRSERGVTHDEVHCALADPNDVTVIHDFDSGADAESFVADLRAEGIFSELGVEGAPEIWITDPVD
ncbi:hypothetical protein [Pseudoruegeria sp. HB172150]|uniref:hypothetical protein n=1 Tax=Pseudoruegeria sp. HB172150 TaxID=2721164 RepID=UPI0015572080|nr:hypothetical protein [Pseudoruegeria sp. HB172150]